MGIMGSKEEAPPPMVLVPALFDFSPLGARTSKAIQHKNLAQALDDPHVDLIATVSDPLDNKSDGQLIGNAQFRYDVDDPHTFVDFFVANTDPVLRMWSCAYYPKYGLGPFGIIPLISKERISPEDYGVMGLRYGSGNLSCGMTSDEFPRSAWLFSKMGRLTTGVQYEPLCGVKDDLKLKNLKNWSCAVGYGLGSGSPLSPSFNFSLELANSNEFIASFYQHVVVQRRVQNPLEENGIIGITNYLDFGFELKTRLEETNTSNTSQDSAFQVATSWQANKNFMLKAKTGPPSSTPSLAFKSWWKPSFTFSVSATRDHKVGNTSMGFGIRVENLREASYERADPNFVILTPRSTLRTACCGKTRRGRSISRM